MSQNELLPSANVPECAPWETREGRSMFPESRGVSSLPPESAKRVHLDRSLVDGLLKELGSANPESECAAQLVRQYLVRLETLAHEAIVRIDLGYHEQALNLLRRPHGFDVMVSAAHGAPRVDLTDPQPPPL